MLQGLHSAASGMAAAQARLDSVANDIANANTTGYRRQRVAFHDLLYVADRRGAAPGLAIGTGAGVRDAGLSGQGGALQQTGRPLDVAVEGAGFLRVRRPDGTIALTRAGALQIDGGGVLRTAAGDRVLPGIRLPRGGDAEGATIGPDGTVNVGERAVGRLDVVTVASPEGLTPLGDGLFAATQASGAPRVTRDIALAVGSLEGSSVDLSEAMVDMIEAQRAFQFAGKAVSTQDELMRIANQVKR